MRGGRKWLLAVAVTLGLVCLGANVVVALSPVNISPGYPTSLDDAYPVPTNQVVIQSAIRPDITRNDSGSESGRFRATHDIRYGATENMELTVSGTSLRGPLNPGTMDDPRSIQLGILARFRKQAEERELLPSISVRVLGEVPYAGDRTNPGLRGALVTSWNLGNRWWLHGNLGYEVVPSFQPGHWVPHRSSIILVNLGFVKALDESSAIVGGLRFQEDPLNSKKQVASPELGYVLALDKHWLFSLSASRDFLGSVGQAAFRGSVGVIYAF